MFASKPNKHIVRCLGPIGVTSFQERMNKAVCQCSSVLNFDLIGERVEWAVKPVSGFVCLPSALVFLGSSACPATANSFSVKSALSFVPLVLVTYMVVQSTQSCCELRC